MSRSGSYVSSSFADPRKQYSNGQAYLLEEGGVTRVEDRFAGAGECGGLNVCWTPIQLSESN